MLLVFDSSIHLGQFCPNNEAMRVFSKNSQACLSQKPSNQTVGLVSFDENSFADDFIWSLERKVQDTFYKFMDRFHSITNITRIPLSQNTLKLTSALSKKFGIQTSNALTCSLAMQNGAQELHSFYSDFKKPKLVDYLAKNGVKVNNFVESSEKQFASKELEKFYQETLVTFRSNKINPVAAFHK